MLATPDEEDVWLAVQEDGVSVLDFISMVSSKRPLGGPQSHFYFIQSIKVLLALCVCARACVTRGT